MTVLSLSPVSTFYCPKVTLDIFKVISLLTDFKFVEHSRKKSRRAARFADNSYTPDKQAWVM